MVQENIIDTIRKALTQIGQETLEFIPNIFLVLIIIAIAILAIKVVNFGFRKILKVTKLDRMFKKISGFSLPFTIDGLIIFLADVGIGLITVYAIVNVFLGPQYMELMNEGLLYGARIVSVVVMALILLTIFNLLIGKIKVENRLRGYAMLIVLLLITAMLIDVTALSTSVKEALTSGLALGVGISIGIFAFWFFFHEYLDKIIRDKENSQNNNQSEQEQQK